VFLIHQGTNLIGFITFQEHGDQWSLDLMRSGDVQVDGAMHLAVATAITQAASLGIARVSLAAVSDCHLTFGCAITAKTDGLLQFKQSFRPAWIPLYHAAPNRLLFAITLGAVTWAIQRPIARSWQSFALKFTTRYETPHPYPAE
jgi:phosphatidylglycerol lysyltransferase